MNAIALLRRANPALDVRGDRRWYSGRLITFAVSYTFNGGPAYEVPPLVVPAGYQVIDIGIGLNFNARPPRATKLLVKEGDK